MIQFKAKISDIAKDIVSGGYKLTFFTETLPNIQGITDRDLTVSVKQYRQKRSLNANDYSWVLLDRIAKAVRSTSEEVYEEMLRRYGYPLYDEDEKPVIITIKPTIDITKLDMHLKYIGDGHVDGSLFKHYKVIRGQSTYDTHEMSVFIDGIVSEAKELGIETLTPDELERMKAAWKV